MDWYKSNTVTNKFPFISFFSCSEMLVFDEIKYGDCAALDTFGYKTCRCILYLF